MHSVDLTPLVVALAQAILPGLFYFVGSVVMVLLTPYLIKVLGAARAKYLTDNFQVLMHNSIAAAVPQMVDQIQRQGWTIDIQNELARKAAQMAVQSNAKLATWAAAGSTTLETKALSRLASHPDVKDAVSGVSPPDPSNDNASASAAA